MTEAEIVESLAAWREAELQAARTGQSVTVYNLGQKQAYSTTAINGQIDYWTRKVEGLSKSGRSLAARGVLPGD